VTRGQDRGGRDLAASGGGDTPQRAGKRDKGALRDWIEATYGTTPAIQLAQRAFMDPAAYARAAGMTKGKGAAKTWDTARAFVAQGRDLERLLPYTEQKMPTAVEIEETNRVILQLGRLDAGELPPDAQRTHTINLVPANMQQNQRLSLDQAAPSDMGASDDEG
jgi:hypothetical protein